MENNRIFRINSPQVVSETIDGEVIIINLDLGIYYSLLGTGADVWSKIEGNLDRDSTIQAIIGSYSGSAEEMAMAIDEFLADLQAERLIVVDESNVATTNDDRVPETHGNIDKPQFVKPLLEKFTDMESLLLLDPVHEVDVEAGWPSAKTP